MKIQLRGRRMLCGVLSGLLAGMQITGGAQVISVMPAESGNVQPGTAWSNEGDSLEGISEAQHVNVWKVEDYELDTMYGDPYVLRRQDNTHEAWITLELPYVKKLSVMGYTWPEHEGQFAFFVSKDGKNWETAKPVVTRTPDPDEIGWTKYQYDLNGMYGVRYVKIQWPQVEESSNDWWNPYLGWMQAEIGMPVEDHIEVTVPERLEIPRFDSSTYALEAWVADQLGERMDYPIFWEAKQELPEGVTLSETGLTVNSQCVPKTVVQLTAKAEVPEYTDRILGIDQMETETILMVEKVPTGNTVIMEKEVVITLEAAVLGDVNHDGVLDGQEISVIQTYYGADTTHAEWNMLRLADIDESGMLDVIDLAYLAYHCQEGEEKPEENKKS